MTDDQRQEWQQAIAAAARNKLGDRDRGRRYRQRRTGLAKVSGAGMVRITQTTAAEVAAAAPPTEE